MYIVSSDIFLSVTALTFTKVLDPNSGYGLQFLFFMIVYIYVCSQSTTISHLFSSSFCFIGFAAAGFKPAKDIYLITAILTYLVVVFMIAKIKAVSFCMKKHKNDKKTTKKLKETTKNWKNEKNTKNNQKYFRKFLKYQNYKWQKKKKEIIIIIEKKEKK